MTSHLLSVAIGRLCSRAARSAAPVRRRSTSGAAVALGVLAAAAWITAHEGHNAPLRPIYKQVHVGDAVYRVGFAMMPQDPLVGEDIRFELRVLRRIGEDSGAPLEEPVRSEDPQVQILSTGAAVGPLPTVAGETAGTFRLRHRFAEPGDYGISTRVAAGADIITAEFPVFVRPGPVAYAPIVVDVVVLLLFGAVAVSLWRRRRDDALQTQMRASAGAFAAAGVVVLLVAHIWVAPRIGRLFLPERHFGSIAWEGAAPGGSAPGAPSHVDPPGTPPHSHAPGTPPHSHPSGTAPHRDSPDAADRGADVPPRGIVSTVVPVPGQLVDVMVPASARVLFDGFAPRVGRAVRRGQTIATLEYHYVLHDAVHLINQRYLSMVAMLAARRASLDTELRAARLRHLRETADASVRQMMDVTHAVEAAELEAATAKLEHERAARLLAMHDAEITQRELVRRPVVSPIDGTIEAVNFTQGQLKYENDKLFTILNLSTVWIEARVPGEFASRRPPERIQFTSPAFPSQRFEGRLARVANALDPDSGTLSAFYEAANPDRLLRLGMRLAADAPGANAPADDAEAPVGTSADNVRRAVARPAADPPMPPAVTLSGMVKPNPALTADVTAPLWGRIEFAARRLNVGDRVKKGENLLRIVLELSADERYPMNARKVEIEGELAQAQARREQAEQQWAEAVGRLKAAPAEAFRQEEARLLEGILRAARDEEALLTRQSKAYAGTIQRRDPKITMVPAPISGVITHIGFRPGELNTTGEFRQLLTIVDPSRVWLEAEAYEHQSAAILKGFGRASFTSPGIAERPLERPLAVSGALSPQTGALRVIFDVPNPSGALKIGAPAQIVVARD